MFRLTLARELPTVIVIATTLAGVVDASWLEQAGVYYQDDAGSGRDAADSCLEASPEVRVEQIWRGLTVPVEDEEDHYRLLLLPSHAGKEITLILRSIPSPYFYADRAGRYGVSLEAHDIGVRSQACAPIRAHAEAVHDEAGDAIRLAFTAPPAEFVVISVTQRDVPGITPVVELHPRSVEEACDISCMFGYSVESKPSS